MEMCCLSVLVNSAQWPLATCGFTRHFTCAGTAKELDLSSPISLNFSSYGVASDSALGSAALKQAEEMFGNVTSRFSTF